MVLLEEIKRLDDSGKVLLGEFLTEVSELVPQFSGIKCTSCFSHSEWVISKPGVTTLQFSRPDLSFSHLLPVSWKEKKKKIIWSAFQEKCRVLHAVLMSTLPRGQPSAGFLSSTHVLQGCREKS